MSVAALIDVLQGEKGAISQYTKSISFFISWKPMHFVIYKYICGSLLYFCFESIGVKYIQPAYRKPFFYALFMYLSPLGLHRRRVFPKYNKNNADRWCPLWRK